MGKTTVVEAFRAEVATDPAVWLAAGQCVAACGHLSATRLSTVRSKYAAGSTRGT
jgi:hypothetical protein